MMFTRLWSNFKQPSQRNLFAASGLYLFYYIALGAFLPYIYLYYQMLGFTGIEIGVLAALPVLISSVSTLFIGGLTDKYHWHRNVLWVALIVCPVIIFLLSQAKAIAAIIPIIVVYAIFNSPIVPLLDSSAVEIAAAQSRSYGLLRVWGSIGWAVSSVVVGWLIQRSGFSWLFRIYIFFMISMFFLSLLQPARKIVLQSPFYAGLKDLLKQSKFLMFLVSIFLLNVASGGVMAFFSIYMNSIGAGEGLIGWAWALSAVSEMPFMAFSGKILKRIGSKGLLLVSFSAYAVRWMLMSFIHNPSLVLLVQLMHGLSFALMLVGSVNFINEHTPGGLNTTALAIFNTVAYGLGSMLGSLLGGFIDERWSLVVLFRVCAALVTAGLIILVIGQRDRRLNVRLN